MLTFASDQTCLPERRLIAAIIGRAIRDVRGSRSSLALDALLYLEGPNFDNDSAWIGLNPEAVRETIKEQKMPKNLFTPDQIAALHGRYLIEEVTIRDLAREIGVAPATLHRHFKEAGLPTRRAGRIRGSAASRQTDMDDINRILAGLIPPDGVRSVKVTVEFAISDQQDPT